jgi:chromate transporter
VASSEPSAGAADGLRQPASCGELFFAFNRLALQGFGGVIAVAQHALVDRERWLSREQFLEMLSVSQVLPGPNVVNLSMMIGDRFFGWRGACAALAGMLVMPLVIVLALAAIYAGYAHHPVVSGALRGMGAVSAGLMFGTALKLASNWRTHPIGGVAYLGIGALTCVLVVWFKWPLAWVVLGLGGLSMAYAWQRLRRSLQ